MMPKRKHAVYIKWQGLGNECEEKNGWLLTSENETEEVKTCGNTKETVTDESKKKKKEEVDEEGDKVEVQDLRYEENVVKM